MARFRKKPVEIDALNWNGLNLPECRAFLGDSYNGHIFDRSDIVIKTLEGDIIASLGDWLIRGVKGEHYPCKPDIFELTYDPVNELISEA